MQIKALYTRTIYETQKDGVIVGLYWNLTDSCAVIITGAMLPTIENVNYVFDGDWVTHKKYGKQFKAEYYSEDISDRESIIRFLSSKVIKGVGPATAVKIVDAFGDDTIKVLDEDIERVLTIPRFPKTKFKEFKESYETQRGAKDVIVALGKVGISVKLALSAYERFKKDTMNIINDRPYRLSEIAGISFPIADRLGKRTYEYEHDYERFCSCAYYCLYANEAGVFYKITGNTMSGSNGMQKDEFGKVMLNLLRFNSINGKFICDMTIKMLDDKKLVYVKKDGDVYFFPVGLFNIERESAKELERIMIQPNVTNIDVDKELKKIKFDFSTDQISAIKNAFKNHVSLIIGIPGTGKTTTINTIVKLYRKDNPEGDVYLLAPTGRASARIRETITDKEANVSTIHIPLEIKVDEINDIDEEKDIKFNDCLIVVDEMSMTDTRLFYRLVKAIGSNCRIILCGDDEQLQSVGSGAVLRDLIDSKCICTTRLTKVFRQSEESSIYHNLFKIREGSTDLIYKDDFSFMEESDLPKIEEMMIDKYIEKINEVGIDNVMLLSPYKKGEAGVFELNNRLQEILNPNDELEFRSIYKFRIKDVVMQTKNDYDTGVMNGDIGIVQSIYTSEDKKKMSVAFGKKIVTYDKETIDELVLGYAYTIHKAQGSEAKCVIMCCHSYHAPMLKRNVYYTAVTRASKEVYIYGQKSAFNKAIVTKDSDRRITMLKDLIKLYSGEFVSIGVRNGNL